MNQELILVFKAIGFGLAGGIIFSLPFVIWRLIRKQPIIPRGNKLKSPMILYTGIAVFGGFALLSFSNGRPYFGAIFVLFVLAYIIGLVAYKRGWRG
jgi:hypothetical protein